MGKFGLQLTLLGLTGVSLAVSVACTLVYVRTVGELRNLDSKNATIFQFQSQAQAVAAAALEYSKKDPGIDPILISIGAKPKPAGSTGNSSSAPASTTLKGGTAK
ncbi:MAG: hypothetical protein JWN25_3259 [Verrucomicrobiales bacterium]|nr:hypothetical protein [Verrucomicrobiales bacterium]MDB6131670.1 hypothetical protein [Verrucomicrobiales bacterium]